MFKHVYTMEIDLKGKGKSKIHLKPIDIMSGKIAKTGNGAHVLIKLEKAREVGLGKRVGILFFEWNGGKE